jgi:hypothetical protein
VLIVVVSRVIRSMQAELYTLKHGIWPISKHDLIAKHLNSFIKFTNSIDFDKL